MGFKKILKYLYKVTPFKKQFFLIVKQFWKPREKMYRHFHFSEAFKVKIEKDKSFWLYNGTSIENEIFWEGLTEKWEKESMKLWLKLSKKSEHIIDIGANNGVYGLVAKAVNPKSIVYCFEPHPVFFKNLEKNIKRNDFSIKAFKTAVSDVNGNLKIEDYSGTTVSIEVDSITLDTFMQKNKIATVDLLKIDVETFEPQVIKGFSKNLAKSKPTLLIEILNEEVAESINDLVKGLGYLYFNIDEENGIRQTEKVEKSDYYNYLICQPNIAKEIGLINDL
jgi:FkbM family methyltransferase